MKGEVGTGWSGEAIRTGAFLRQLKGEINYNESKHYDITVVFNKYSILK